MRERGNWVLGLAWLLAAGAAWAGSGGKIAWEGDLATGRERADIEKKPIILYFYGDS